MVEKFTTQRATKVVAGGFPVAVGCNRAIELVSGQWKPSRCADRTGICQGPYLTEKWRTLYKCSGLRKTLLISMRFEFHE
jgi:hypothetical protein